MRRRNLGCVVLASFFAASKAFSGAGNCLASTRNAFHQHQAKSNDARGQNDRVSRCRYARSCHCMSHVAKRCSMQIYARKVNSAAEKSIFNQAINLKLPWWDNDDDVAGRNDASSKSQASRQDRDQQRTREKPRRVPRYPSALEANIYSDNNDVNRAGKSDTIDEYVRSESIDSTATTNDSDKRNCSSQQQSTKLGILLIDHGSKLKASNDHLHSVAASYQHTWDQKNGIDSVAQETNSVNENTSTKATRVKVRAAHMEIASPSILATLRQLITEDEASHVVCVPYFLSPGKHATIDVPHLINEARDSLKKEGLLELNSNQSRRDGEGRAEVKIISSEALGSNVESMLKVVDGLVRMTLEDGGEVCKGLDGINRLSGRAKCGNGIYDNNVEELRKYTNRATLLENTLQSKVRQLKTMTNRVTLLEDALTRLKNKMKEDKKEISDRQKDGNEILVAQVANLTDSIKAMCQDKDALENEMAASLAQQKIDLEKEYNETITGLDSARSLLEQELHHKSSKEPRQRKQQDNEHAARNCEVELQGEKIEQQKEQIQHLQIQLEHLLDANAELEQLLENSTVAVIEQYKDRLQESQERYDSSLKLEQEDKKKYKEKWMDIQQGLEEESFVLQQNLNDTTSKYKALLEEEKAEADKWKREWKLLNNTLFLTKNFTIARTVDAEEWRNLNHELEKAILAKDDAVEKLRDLELHIVEQQKNITQQQLKESSERGRQQLQQQEQLQEYLQTQLDTYYKTIQIQTSQISKLECQIKDMEQIQDDSMLIATNSFEASKKRERNLLNNVEELESDLAAVKKERDDREKWLNDLQIRLDRMDDDARETSVTAGSNPNNQEIGNSVDRHTLFQQCKDLIIQVETLEFKIKNELQEKEQIIMDKMMLEEEIRRLIFVPRRLRAMISTTSSSPVNGNVAAPKAKEPKKQRQQGRRWVRAALRPWSLLRKQGSEKADQSEHDNDQRRHQ